MKRQIVFAAGVGAFVVATPMVVSAADLPVKAPPRIAAAAVGSWTGFYVGIHGGYGWGDADYAFPGDIPAGFGGFNGVFSPFNGGGFSQRISGGVFGGHAGYNQQFGNVVVGLEASASWSGFKGRSVNVFPAAQLFNGIAERSYATKLDWFATLTPRLGYASGSWLFYGKAGLAAGQVVSDLTSANLAPPTVFHERNGHVGWTVGAGVEHMWTPNWIAGLEYNYVDLGREQYGGLGIRNGVQSGRGQYDLSLSYHTVLARLSYKAADGRATVAAAGQWSGFYAGVHGGYGWGDANYESRLDTAPFYFPPAATGGGAFSQRVDGGIVGGHLGANHQNGNLLVGIEGAFSRSGLKGSSQDVFAALPTTETYVTELEWLATVTPRLGYIGGNWLIYGRGGLAIGRAESRMTTTFSGGRTFRERTHHTGWTVGAGLEFAWTPNWIFGVEYNYLDLGKEQYGGHQVDSSGANDSGPGYSVGLTFSTVTARLSYKLSGAP